MSWHCGASQPILMDVEVVQKAVNEQAPRDQAGRIAIAEGIDFNEVLTLHLDFKLILKIDNLWDFTSLTRLYLNNNFLMRIEGLDNLVNLTWLNLSFNRLEKIEGLESLRKLEFLNLSNNKISIIENMDELEKLSHFCIANNLLEQLDNKKEASVKHYLAVEKIKHEELQRQQADDAEQSEKAELQLHTDAFVEFLNGDDLFKSMFKDDPEADTIQSVTGVTQLRQTFEQQMVELCVQLFELGLAEHERREAEVSAFLSDRSKVVTDYQKKASQILEEFQEPHQEMMVALQQLSDPDKLEVEIDQCNDALNELHSSLMSVEFKLNSLLEDIIKEFDVNVSDMVDSFTETVQGIFAQCRELEDSYHQNVKDIALATLEKVASDSAGEESSDVRWLFTDKNMVMDVLATGHDNHLLKINDRETQLVTRVSAWKVSLIKGIQEKEVKRTHVCISDILQYMDHLREQLDEFQDL